MAAPHGCYVNKPTPLAMSTAAVRNSSAM